MSYSTVLDDDHTICHMDKVFKALKQQMVEELNRDPVPQISSEEVQNTTTWLDSCITAMHEAISLYSLDGLKTLSYHDLELASCRVREACRRLSLLHSDKALKFGGVQATGAVVLSAKLQSEDIRMKLKEFADFLNTFGSEEWLGSLVRTEFMSHKATALSLLAGLQNPTKRVFCAKCSCIHDSTTCPMYSVCPHGKYRSKCVSCCRNESEYSAASLYRAVPPDDGTVKGNFFRMAEMAEAFMSASRRNGSEHGQRMQQLEHKMVALKHFTQTLTELPKVMRCFILLRIDSFNDYEALKAWVSQEEATNAHQILERFRDEAIEEKAFRRLVGRAFPCQGTSPSVASDGEPSVTSESSSFVHVSDIPKIRRRARSLPHV